MTAVLKIPDLKDHQQVSITRGDFGGFKATVTDSDVMRQMNSGHFRVEQTAYFSTSEEAATWVKSVVGLWEESPLPTDKSEN